MYRVVHDTPDFDSVPTSIRPLIEQALSKVPDERPTALDLVARLANDDTVVTDNSVIVGDDVTRVVTALWSRPDYQSPQLPRPMHSRSAKAQWLVVALLALIGLVAGLLWFPATREAAEPASATTTSSISSSSTTTATSLVTTTTAGPDPSSPRSYFTLDGSTPSLPQTCVGLLGKCLGEPIESIIAMLGTEDSRLAAADGNGITRYWRLDGLTINVTADEIGTVTAMGGGFADGTAGGRLNLPEGLTLGTSTMGQVKQRLGPPDDTDEAHGENMVLRSLIYWVNAEGIDSLVFTHDTTEDKDTGSFTGAFDQRLVESFDARPTPFPRRDE